jgi:hypothetical protein
LDIIRFSSIYSHSNTCYTGVEDGPDIPVVKSFKIMVEELRQCLCKEFYIRLQEEYEWQTSEEQAKENLTFKDDRYLADGSII